jgi:hypothetical protein
LEQSSSRLASSSHNPLEPTEPIATSQQFLDWFALVEAAMEMEQGDVFRRCKSEVEAYIGACNDILSKLDDCQGLLAEMDANYRFVNDNSKSLQTACESLLEEQVRILAPPGMGCLFAQRWKNRNVS